MMIETIRTWLAAHPIIRGALYMISIPIFFAWVNWVTWKETPEEWERYQREHPILAYLLRASRRIFPHLRKFFPQLAPFLPPESKR